MKPITKQVIVISTMIDRKIQYVAGGHSKHGFYADKHIVQHTTDIAGWAKEFPTAAAAAEFIPTIYNPHEKRYEVVTETISFTSRKAFNEYEKII